MSPRHASRIRLSGAWRIGRPCGRRGSPALQSREQHQAHLQQHFELLGNAVGLAIGKALGTVPPCSRNASPRWAAASSLAQLLDLPGHHDGRQARELGHRALERSGIFVLRLLRGLARLPARRVPGVGIGRAHATMLPCVLCRGTNHADRVGPGRRQDRRTDLRPAGALRLLSGYAGGQGCRRGSGRGARPRVSRTSSRCDSTPPTRAALAQCLRAQRLDAVVSSLPYHCNPVVAAAAREAGAHYFDLTEDVAVTRRVSALAQASVRLRTAVWTRTRIHQHRRRRADPPLRQPAQRAAARRAPCRSTRTMCSSIRSPGPPKGSSTSTAIACEAIVEGTADRGAPARGPRGNRDRWHPL